MLWFGGSCSSIVVSTTSPVVYTHDIKLQLERKINMFNLQVGQKLHTCVNRPLQYFV